MRESPRSGERVRKLMRQQSAPGRCYSAEGRYFSPPSPGFPPLSPLSKFFFVNFEKGERGGKEGRARACVKRIIQLVSCRGGAFLISCTSLALYSRARPSGIIDKSDEVALRCDTSLFGIT